MKKQIILLGTVILIICINLSGCNDKSNKDKFIGSWEEETGEYSWSIYTFNADNTLEINNGKLSGTWSLSGNKVILVVDGEEQTTQEFTYAFSDNDNILSLTFHEAIYTTILHRKI